MALLAGGSMPFILWLTHTAPSEDHLPRVAIHVMWLFYVELTVISVTVAFAFFALLLCGLWLGKMLVPEGSGLGLREVADNAANVDRAFKYELDRYEKLLTSLDTRLTDITTSMLGVLDEHETDLDELNRDFAGFIKYVLRELGAIKTALRP